MDTAFKLCKLTEEHFEPALELCYKVHGDNFYTHKELQEEVNQGTIGELSCSYVLYDIPKKKLVGLRITSAPGQWEIGKTCSPDDWGVDPTKVCYFHTAAIDSEYRGAGIGSYLLQTSIDIAKKMDAKAGLAHIWLQSPNNGAFKYFTKNGGKIIKGWPEQWIDFHNAERPCPRCGSTCHCDAAEMIIHFGELEK